MNNLNLLKMIAAYTSNYADEIEDLDAFIRKEALYSYSIQLGEVELAFIKREIFLDEIKNIFKK
jgi:hypothetical protein